MEGVDRGGPPLGSGCGGVSGILVGVDGEDPIGWRWFTLGPWWHPCASVSSGHIVPCALSLALVCISTPTLTPLTPPLTPLSSTPKLSKCWGSLNTPHPPPSHIAAPPATRWQGWEQRPHLDHIPKDAQHPTASQHDGISCTGMHLHPVTPTFTL